LSVIEAVKPAGYDNWLEKVQWQVHNKGDSYKQAFGLESQGEVAGAFAYTRFKAAEHLLATSGDEAGEIPQELRSDGDGAIEIEAEPQMTLEQ
jgi:hypothetical protein